MGTTVVVAISPVQRRCRLAKRLYRLPYQKSRDLGTPGESQHGIRAVHTLIDRRALQVSAVHISRVLSAASSSSIFDTTISPLSFFDTFLLSTFHHYDYGRPWER